ncbi:MAG: hypothetical protein RL518_17 [Pseudomonadota bacterium]|jgi:hypothetical protein
MKARFAVLVNLVASVLAFGTPSGESNAQALPITEPLAINLRVEAKPEPKKAIGMVLSAGTTVEIPDTTIKKIGEKLYLISFVVDRNIIRKDSVATAMAFDENGNVTFANVSPELLSESKSLLSRIPECPPEDPSAAVKLDQKGPLEQLVDVRLERAELARLKISRMLDEQFMFKLQRFEDAFGLDKSEELNANLPPEVLVDRLSRITHAVKKYRMFKKAPTPTPVPGE